MSQDITIKELINQFQREISSAIHDLGAVSAFSKKLPQCQVDQLNREFLRLGSLLEEVDKKIKRASSKISQGNEKWGGGSFSTINSSSTDSSFVPMSSSFPQQKITGWDVAEKVVTAVQAASTIITMIGSPPPPNPTPLRQKQDSAYVQYQDPNSCSLKDKIDSEESPVVKQYKDIPEIIRGKESKDQLEEIYQQQKEAEAERRKKKLDIVEDQEMAAGSPPPDQS